MDGRRSGLLVPLFSLTSSESWGVGEFADLPTFAAWAHSAGQSVVQVLPITELPDHETSPYSSLTAMALDPIHIRVAAVAEFAAMGGEEALDSADRAALADVRRAPRVDHHTVRALKSRTLRRAYDHFARHELGAETERAAQFRAFVAAERWWLDEYALFQALRTHASMRPWWDWPAPLAHHDDDALASAREQHAPEIGYREYVQWLAAGQWADARRAARPVAIFGDLPFMISADSPDVWARQQEFRFDATVGVPPDAFSETGQDWGLPPWRWDVMAGTDFVWMRARARRMADLFDGFRLDHLVGLFRTYVRPIDKATAAAFAPADEPTQRALGERLVSIYRQAGAEITAEDLGTVPDFVRESITRLEVPGYKVLRWERDWHAATQPFSDPAGYPTLSVGTTGTHDNEPLVVWWQTVTAAERRLLLEIPSVQARVTSPLDVLAAADDMPRVVIDAVIGALLAGASALVLLPIQDLFGWRDRINTPAVVNDENWTWRLPWPVDALATVAAARDRAAELAAMSRAAGRIA